jgi:hypothetical protein
LLHGNGATKSEQRKNGKSDPTKMHILRRSFHSQLLTSFKKAFRIIEDDSKSSQIFKLP